MYRLLADPVLTSILGLSVNTALAQQDLDGRWDILSIPDQGACNKDPPFCRDHSGRRNLQRRLTAEPCHLRSRSKRTRSGERSPQQDKGSTQPAACQGVRVPALGAPQDG